MRAALILFPLLGVPNLLGAIPQSSGQEDSLSLCAYMIVNALLYGFQVINTSISRWKKSWFNLKMKKEQCFSCVVVWAYCVLVVLRSRYKIALLTYIPFAFWGRWSEPPSISKSKVKIYFVTFNILCIFFSKHFCWGWCNKL